MQALLRDASSHKAVAAWNRIPTHLATPIPEGPSTQYLRVLVPQALPFRALDQRP